jgi:hypothetical protein
VVPPQFAACYQGRRTQYPDDHQDIALTGVPVPVYFEQYTIEKAHFCGNQPGDFRR